MKLKQQTLDKLNQFADSMNLTADVALQNAITVQLYIFDLMKTQRRELLQTGLTEEEAEQYLKDKLPPTFFKMMSAIKESINNPKLTLDELYYDAEIEAKFWAEAGVTE